MQNPSHKNIHGGPLACSGLTLTLAYIQCKQMRWYNCSITYFLKLSLQVVVYSVLHFTQLWRHVVKLSTITSHSTQHQQPFITLSNVHRVRTLTGPDTSIVLPPHVARTISKLDRSYLSQWIFISGTNGSWFAAFVYTVVCYVRYRRLDPVGGPSSLYWMAQPTHPGLTSVVVKSLTHV